MIYIGGCLKQYQVCYIYEDLFHYFGNAGFPRKQHLGWKASSGRVQQYFICEETLKNHSIWYQKLEVQHHHHSITPFAMVPLSWPVFLKLIMMLFSCIFLPCSHFPGIFSSKFCMQVSHLFKLCVQPNIVSCQF